MVLHWCIVETFDNENAHLEIPPKNPRRFQFNFLKEVQKKNFWATFITSQ